MSEAELTAEVIKLCGRLGLLCHHCTDSTRCVGAGLPDLIIAGPRGLIFTELKSRGGRLRAVQLDWRYTLLAAGLQWRMWTPENLRNGTIEASLQLLV